MTRYGDEKFSLAKYIRLLLYRNGVAMGLFVVVPNTALYGTFIKHLMTCFLWSVP